jgi:hypothetical protein
MVSVVVGITGLMHFWDLALSAITTIQIILGVGICVSFTVHTSHAFMTATGKNRNDRVAAALEKVSVPILNGALASLLSTVPMALGNSFVFVSFYKTMILVFVLGVLHSVVFLPVMLSFIGPRRTSKPRLFVGNAASTGSASGVQQPGSDRLTAGHVVQRRPSAEQPLCQGSDGDGTSSAVVVDIPLGILRRSSAEGCVLPEQPVGNTGESKRDTEKRAVEQSGGSVSGRCLGFQECGTTVIY